MYNICISGPSKLNPFASRLDSGFEIDWLSEPQQVESAGPDHGCCVPGQ